MLFTKFQIKADRKLEANEIIIKYLKKVISLKAGNSFGEISLLLSKPRTATVKAVWDCDLATLSKEKFIEIMGKVQEIQTHKVSIYLLIPYRNLIFWVRFQHLTGTREISE